MKKKMLAAAAAAVLVGLVMSGCSASPSPANDSKAPITVWVDATRLPVAQAYVKAHRKEKIKIETIDETQGSNTSKLTLAEKSGTGIPDVVFLGTPDEIATIAANPINYPMALNTAVPKKVLDGFPKGTISRCTFGGKIYCLSNDIGQTVLWYNKKLFTQWGYTVPTTMEEFKDLGIKLATEHPGYSLGTVNGRYGVDAFFGSSGCPIYNATTTAVKINTASPKCTRVGDVLSPLQKNGTLSQLDLFDKSFTAQVAADKVVAMVGASWAGAFVFKSNLPKNPGEYTAAAMPSWGDSTNYSGAIGGGIWMVSAKSKNSAEAVKFTEAMTTDPTYAASGVTYPGYTPAATVWLKAVSSDSWYASDPAPAMVSAASKINPAIGYVRYETGLLQSFTDTVVKNGGTDMPGALQQWGTQATQLATSAGYTVSK
ncbi:ABC transporter substrate-binding protein [Leifsonia sp. 2MCAF36]|uniref:ABC transporter substrate-binding protein n=1 Tax=Leifsonia sp. 2MCAF36 TaxID=3232988 RepID=UPI003F99CE0A